MFLFRSVFGPFAREHSLLQLRLSFSPDFSLPLFVDIQEFEGVIDEIFLDHLIKRSVSGKGGRVVDLKYLRL